MWKDKIILESKSKRHCERKKEKKNTERKKDTMQKQIEKQKKRRSEKQKIQRERKIKNRNFYNRLLAPPTITFYIVCLGKFALTFFEHIFSLSLSLSLSPSLSFSTVECIALIWCALALNVDIEEKNVTKMFPSFLGQVRNFWRS